MGYPANIQPLVTPPQFQAVGNAVYQPFTTDRHIQTQGISDSISLQLTDIPADGDTLTFIETSYNETFEFKTAGADEYNRLEIDISGAISIEEARNMLFDALNADFNFLKHFNVTKSGTDTLIFTNAPSGNFTGSSLSASNIIDTTIIELVGTDQIVRSNYQLYLLPYIESPCRGSESFTQLQRLAIPHSFSDNYIFDLAKSFIGYLKFDVPALEGTVIDMLDGMVKKYQFQIGELFGDNSTSNKLFNGWGNQYETEIYIKRYNDILKPLWFVVNARLDAYKQGLIQTNDYGECLESVQISDELANYFDTSRQYYPLTAMERETRAGNVDFFAVFNSHRRISDMQLYVSYTFLDGSTGNITIPYSGQTITAKNCCATMPYYQVLSMPLRLLWDNVPLDYSNITKLCLKVQAFNWHESEALAAIQHFVEQAELAFDGTFKIDYQEGAYRFFEFLNVETAGTTSAQDLVFETAQYVYRMNISLIADIITLVCESKSGGYHNYATLIYTLDNGLTYIVGYFQNTGSNISLDFSLVDGEIVSAGNWEAYSDPERIDITYPATYHLNNDVCNWVSFLYQNALGIADTLHVFQGKEQLMRTERLEYEPTLNAYKSDTNLKLNDRQKSDYDNSGTFEYATTLKDGTDYQKTSALDLFLSNAAYEIQNHRGAINDADCSDCDPPCTPNETDAERLMPIVITSKNANLIKSGSGSSELTITWAEARDNNAKLAI